MQPHLLFKRTGHPAESNKHYIITASGKPITHGTHNAFGSRLHSCVCRVTLITCRVPTSLLEPVPWAQTARLEAKCTTYVSDALRLDRACAQQSAFSLTCSVPSASRTGHRPFVCGMHLRLGRVKATQLPARVERFPGSPTLGDLQGSIPNSAFALARSLACSQALSPRTAQCQKSSHSGSSALYDGMIIAMYRLSFFEVPLSPSRQFTQTTLLSAILGSSD